MFDQFPKKRSALPDEIAAIYARHYKQNREGRTFASSLSQKMESWTHHQVAKDVRRGLLSARTLEIGAGTLNQLPYEPDVGPYDIIEPFRELYEGSSELGRIRHIFSDISEIDGERKYERITSIGAFEHICHLPPVIARAGSLLTEDGGLRVIIPSEGRLLWTLGWKLTTGLEFRLKHGLDYGLLMKYEHVNSAQEIERLLGYFFRRIEERVFGLSKALSLYQFYVCMLPDVDRCSHYLDLMNENR